MDESELGADVRGELEEGVEFLWQKPCSAYLNKCL